MMKVRTFLAGALLWTIVGYSFVIGLMYVCMDHQRKSHHEQQQQQHQLEPWKRQPWHEEFLAQKRLRENHRIVEGDIAEAGWQHRFFTASLATRDDFVGRYVQRQVEENSSIALETTLTGPKIVPSAGKAIVWISLSDWPAAKIAALDVAQTMDMCNLDGDQKCHGLYAVQAVACAAKDPGKTDASKAECSAAVAVTPDERRRYFESLATDRRGSLVRLADPADTPARRRARKP
jgi:hypothetical protein